MHLLRRIAISNKDKKRKEAATAALIEQDHEKVDHWNEQLQDEAWEKIVEALAARGYPFDPKDFSRDDE